MCVHMEGRRGFQILCNWNYIQTVVRRLLLTVGAKLRPSGKAASTLKYRSISPAPSVENSYIKNEFAINT